MGGAAPGQLKEKFRSVRIEKGVKRSRFNRADKKNKKKRRPTRPDLVKDVCSFHPIPLSSNFRRFCYLAWPALPLPISLPTLEVTSKDKDRRQSLPMESMFSSIHALPSTTPNMVESGGVESDSRPVFRPAPSYRSRSPRASQSVRIPSNKKEGPRPIVRPLNRPRPPTGLSLHGAPCSYPCAKTSFSSPCRMHTCLRITAPRTYAS